MEEERIGKYRVHPVASMFPLLEGKEYEDFKTSICDKGQEHPIVVQNDVLWDGRNRLRACIDLSIEPRVQEYHGDKTPEDYIKAVNIERRHLDPEMHGMLLAEIDAWKISEQNRLAKLSGKSADGLAGGRGNKRNLSAEPCEGLSKQERYKAARARTTAGRIANEAKIGLHKAEAAIAIARNLSATDLATKVKQGAMKIYEAKKQLQSRSMHKPRSKQTKAVAIDVTKPYELSKTQERIKRIHGTISRLAERGGIIDTDELSKMFSNGSEHQKFIESCHLIPWLKIERFLKDRRAFFRFTINQPLKNYCEQDQPLPEFKGYTAGKTLEFLRNLKSTINQKRKEARAERQRRGWNHDAVITQELVNLIDFIEDELEKLTPS